MSKNKLHFLTLCISLFVLSAPLFAQIGGSLGTNTRWGGQNYIVGTVYWPCGQGGETKVGIRLISLTRSEILVMTDDQGRFGFAHVPPGEYTIIVDGEREFEPVSERVEVEQGGVKLSYAVNIRLRKKGGCPSSEPKATVVKAENAGIPPAALGHFDKAVSLSGSGDHRAAINELNQAIAVYPGFANAYNEMGVQYMKLNDLEKADIALQAALKIKPDSFEPLLNRGIVLLRQKRYADSEASLKSALMTNASSAFAQYYLGRTLTALERFDDAEQALKQSITLSGDTLHEAHRMLANLYIARGNDARAIEELEKYLVLAPGASDAENLKKIIVQLKTPPGGKPN